MDTSTDPDSTAADTRRGGPRDPLPGRSPVTGPAAERDHYARHTPFSDPGRFAHLLDALPEDVAGLCAAVRGLVVHYVGSGLSFTPERLAEIDTRWTEDILARLVDHDPAPLTTPRSPDTALVGCCRDFSLLTVSALRHRGVAARTRVGFAPYLDPTFRHDHVVVEYWDRAREAWVRVDPQLDPGLPLWEHVDVQDLGTGSDSPFRTAAVVWRDHRAGRLGADGRGSDDVATYGAGPDLPFRGEWFVGNYVLGELAHLTGHELLLWDMWGAMASGPIPVPADLAPPHLRTTRGAADLGLVDQVAEALLDGTDLDGLLELAADPRLGPGAGVVMVSPSGARGRVEPRG